MKISEIRGNTNEYFIPEKINSEEHLFSKKCIVKPQHIREQRKKEVRQIHKRINEIYDEKRKLGYKKLEKPVRHGWFKEIVITQNVERYRNKKYILELYDIIEKTIWGKTKEDAEKQWFHQVSKFLIYKDFPTISKKQFNRLSEKAQKMCTAYQFRNERKKLKIRFYIRIPKNAYRIKFTRAYITHSKRIDPLLESELDLLNQRLERNEYYNLSPYHYKWRWEIFDKKAERIKVKRELNTLKRYPTEDIINDIIWEKN